MNKCQKRWLQALVDIAISIVYWPGNKLQLLMHYLSVLSFMHLWIKVLILRP